MQVLMQNEENQPNHHDHSNTEMIGNRNALFDIPETSNDSGSTIYDDDVVEITVDIHDDSVVVQSVKTASGADIEDPDAVIPAKGLGKKSTVRTSRIKQVSRELKRFAPIRKPSHHEKFDSTASSATHALKGLKFISTTVGGDEWIVAEKLFNQYTEETNGLLPRSCFGEFIKEAEELANKIREGKEPIMLPKKNEKKKESEELSNKQKEKKENEFALELFDALARRSAINGGLINKAQLRDFWEQMSDKSFDSRLQLFFDMVDKDGDGRITKEEIKEIITLSASDNKLSNIKNKADEYAELFLEELDPHNFGYILIEDLEMLLLQAPTNSVRTDESKNLSKMLSQKLEPRQELNPLRRWYLIFKYFLLDYWERIWVMALWIGVMVGLFAYKYVQYKNKAAYEVMGVCVCLAKGAAETLKLNMALILLPVCRNTMTWLRNNTKLGVAVPFDKNLDFHRIIAIAVAIGVGIHGISHLACDFPRLLHASPEKYELMEHFFGDQPTSYWHFVKGVEGVTGIIMVVLMAIAFTLASLVLRSKDAKGKGKGKEKETDSTKPPNKLTRFYLAKKEKLAGFYLPIEKKLTGFNAFWYSHHLFVIVYALLIVHGIKLYLTHEWYKKTTWMYISSPITLYASERLIRALRSTVTSVRMLKVVVYKANVLMLQMSKPQGFRYKSGQYMFVKCPKVSPFEWHPFSITSAPGDDYLSVHIRKLGDWTGELKDVFSKVCEPSANEKSGLLRAEYLEGENKPNVPRVVIDGPYGAPAQDYQKYKVVLLIGLGIGATPMISIVKDIVNNMKAKENEANAIEDGTSNSTLPSNAIKSGSENGTDFKTRKAYFYWVTREPDSFDWFKGVMNEVAELERDDVIEMHNYCSSVYEEGDARSALITMLQSLNHAKNGIDIISGTRVKSHFGKPNWRDVYKRIVKNHPNSEVGVFYCGASGGAKEPKQLALEFTHTTSTTFDFHKENF